ncbi:MAG: translation initiation factor IF-2 [Alphaproteobacteria bacterium]|nr:translation initiation factor IF-2 [Alphaproteobacteria bacterium]
MSETTNKKDDKNTDDKQAGKKTLSLGGTLSLKGGAAGGARPSMPPGSVAVEVRNRKRAPAPQTKQSNEDAHLSSAEREARIKALQQAMSDGGQAKSALPKRRTTIEDKKKEQAAAAEDREKTAREQELEELRQIEEDERKKTEELRNSAPLPSGPSVPGHDSHGPRKGRFSGDNEETESYRDKLKKAGPKTPPRSVGDRRGGRITVTQALNRDYDRDRGPSLAAQKRAREKARMAAQGALEPAKKVIREVILPETITVGELANRMAEPGGEVVKALMKLGVMATITQTIDADTAELVIDEFGHKAKRVTDADIEVGIEGAQDKAEDLKPRPPVVTIMGHVDHGKTSLLDAMRETNVVSGEAGGITQHIGAYQVTMESGDKITFLDTPGHAAFTEMRARGANVTDIVVIIVSAEDSVMPQTIEAIAHAKAAGVPIIIAVNKIDLPNADPMKVKTELLQHEVVVEDLSGDVQCVEISAKQRINLDKLEEAIMLQAEILELKGNPNREAQGVVVESKLEKGRGSVATVLIQNGTLRIGDVFVAGAEYGKVRALIDDKGQQIEEAVLGQPVEVLGFNGTPEAGDTFSVTPDESKAREISEYRQRKRRESQAAMAVKGRTTIDDIIAARETGEKTALPVIVKGDVHGSVEAIVGSFAKMEEENPDIRVQVLHTGVGGITESDVKLARASGGIIIGFNVRANAQARDLATREGVDIRYYNVIYNVIDDAKAVLSGMLSPLQREEYIGNATIQQVFNITKVGKVAGCMVDVGVVKRGAGVRLLRDDVVIHEGKLKTLQRFKDEVKEVKEGTECGMAFENYDDIKEGDVIECFEIVEEARTVQ